MLSVFRQGGAAQPLVGAVVSLVIVVFVIEFRAASNRGSGKVAVECAVRVGSRCLDEKDYVAAQRLAAWDGMEPRVMRELDFERRIAEGLVERELLLAEAEKIGLGIGDAEVESELEAGRVRVSLPARDLAHLSQRLGLCNWIPNPLISDPDRARKLAVCDPAGPRGVRTIEVKSSKTGRFDYKIYERTIRVRANRSPKEFRESQRDELIAERMRDIIRASVQVTENETWLAWERAKSTAVIEQVTIPRDWFARYLVDAPDAAVDDWAAANQAQVDAAWATEKASFKADCTVVSEIVARFSPTTTDEDKVQLRARIEAARSALDKGADFARLAREVSDGAAAIHGGELGCLDATAYGEGGEALVEATKDLPVGAITPLVETSAGFHLLRVNARPDAAGIELVGRRVVARRGFVRFKSDGLAKRFGDDLVAAARDGAPLEATVERLVRAALETTAGSAATRPEAAGAAAKDAGATSAVDAANRPRVQRIGPFSRLERPIPDATANVAALVFALDKPGAVHPSPIPTGSGYAVVALVEKKPADRAEFDRERLSIQRERQRAKGDEALIEYVAALRKAAEARIEINPNLVAPRKDGEDERE